MKTKELKQTGPVEFELSDHPARAFAPIGGLMEGFDKKRIMRRKHSFFVALNPEDPIDMMMFRRCYPAGVLLLNGHTGAQLRGFNEVFASEKGEQLLKDIHEARPEIIRMENERSQAASQAAIMKVAAEENENPKSVELFFTQIKAAEQTAELAAMKASTLRRKLASDERRLLELLQQENERLFSEQFEYVRQEVEAVNAEIANAFDRARRLTPHVQRAAELAYPSREFSPQFAVWDGNLDYWRRELTSFQAHPALTLKPNAIRFEIRKMQREGDVGK